MDKNMTLKQLVQVASRRLWKGLAYEKTACANAWQFVGIVGENTLVAEISVLTIDKYMDEMEGTVSDATMNRKLANISSILKYAHERELLAKKPKMPFSKESAGRIRWVTPEEETKMLELLEAWGELEVRRFVIVLLETGMRRGELLNLQAKDIDGPWIRLWVNKTDKARSVPLSVRAEQELAKGLFDLDKNKLRQVWGKLKAAMGLEGDDDFVLHTLRHTAATRTLSRTGNIAVVQKQLGHRKIETTMRYAHISDEELLAAVR